MSQLLVRLGKAIQAEADPYKAAEAQAQVAAYLARVGRFAEANDLIHEVRKTYKDGRSGRVTCRLLIAEAVLYYFESFNPMAHDKLARALLLAQALRDVETIRITAVWKAFLDFEYSRFDAMARSIRLVEDYRELDDHGTESRLALVLMLVCLLLGDRVQANKWFHTGHQHSVADGDQASIEALLFNRATFGFARQRLEWCKGQVESGWLHSISAELSSARNLQEMVGLAAMREHVDLSIARIKILTGDFVSARQALQGFLGTSSFAEKHLNIAALQIEIAYCDFQTGSVEAAKDLLATVQLGDISKLDPDEQVYLLTMWDQLSTQHLSEAGVSESKALLKNAWIAYDDYERGLSAACAQIRLLEPVTR
jgi:hypothetical protein